MFSKTARILSSSTSWKSTEIGFGSYLDENLLECIYDLVTAKGDRGKTAAFIGQSYFILQSLFFSNSTLIFIDIRRDLLEAMLQVAKTSKGPREQIPSMGCSIKWKI